jgi:hypothetical protein
MEEVVRRLSDDKRELVEELRKISTVLSYALGSYNARVAKCMIDDLIAKHKEISLDENKIEIKEEERRKAPWKDFAGNDIYEGDKIIHPSGEYGIVVFKEDPTEEADRWLVNYGGSFFRSRLCLQIGDKGKAVVVKRKKLSDK